jgi:hypothetical protein
MVGKMGGFGWSGFLRGDYLGWAIYAKVSNEV